MRYDSDGLLRLIKVRAQLPTNQVTFTNEDFLQFADEEMLIGIVPSILQLHEDYYLMQEDVPLVASTSNYAIPSRAMGSKLRDVSYIDTSGGIFEMSRIAVEDEPFFNTTNTSSIGLKYFMLKNNEIILKPSISAQVAGSLRFSYYIRPNNLVETDRQGLITNIDTGTGVITLETFPDNFTTEIDYDFIMGKSFFKVSAYDISATAVDSITSTVTFDPGDLPTDLAVGDYIMQAGETVIPNIPTELHPMLAQRVACRCLEALGDTQGLQNANLKLAEMEQKLGVLIDNRVEGSPQKIVNRNSLLRRSYYWRRF